MKILLLGGSGIISTSITARLCALGNDVYVLNRGNRSQELDASCAKYASAMGVEARSPIYLRGDCYDEIQVSRLVLEVLSKIEQFDAVIDFMAFTRTDVQKDYRIFYGKTKQFIYISSASVYQKPLLHYLINEGSPTSNPYSEYARNKIDCEDFLAEMYRKEGFPITIIRPSHTYSERSVPLGVHGKNGSWQVICRMLEGKPVIIHGDGTSLWTMTHSHDFARAFCSLIGNCHAIGETVQITGDESLTWNQIYECLAHAVGVSLNAVHVSSEFLAAAGDYNFTAGLIGDKAQSLVFDNTKLKRLVPGFYSEIRFDMGCRQSIENILAHPDLQQLDPEFDAWCDKVIAAQHIALESVRT